ncbi:hypothetical protein DL89DRAFT_280850 [Linderina pennispora]|uniref:Uncharacterized protein n=1 Tax=Linderina pennispora TaxID=61395 RepID=A0A1Y1WLJ1_9FUNG|nr:uncharacterized protein DL89DRAFT_280850 [Linderina pennispora]ORX74441.1 hypothetical protein DL89DRAFT_280850 [Linderina pennispora]
MALELHKGSGSLRQTAAGGTLVTMPCGYSDSAARSAAHSTAHRQSSAAVAAAYLCTPPARFFCASNAAIRGALTDGCDTTMLGGRTPSAGFEAIVEICGSFAAAIVVPLCCFRGRKERGLSAPALSLCDRFSGVAGWLYNGAHESEVGAGEREGGMERVENI